jgi:hypothetical protein
MNLTIHHSENSQWQKWTSPLIHSKTANIILNKKNSNPIFHLYTQLFIMQGFKCHRAFLGLERHEWNDVYWSFDVKQSHPVSKAPLGNMHRHDNKKITTCTNNWCQTNISVFCQVISYLLNAIINNSTCTYILLLTGDISDCVLLYMPP